MIQLFVFTQTFIVIPKQGMPPLTVFLSWPPHPMPSRAHHLLHVLLHHRTQLWRCPPALVFHNLRTSPHPCRRLYLLVIAEPKVTLLLPPGNMWLGTWRYYQGLSAWTENGKGCLGEPGLTHVFIESEKVDPEREKNEVDVQWKIDKRLWSQTGGKRNTNP